MYAYPNPSAQIRRPADLGTVECECGVVDDRWVCFTELAVEYLLRFDKVCFFKHAASPT